MLERWKGKGDLLPRTDAHARVEQSSFYSLSAMFVIICFWILDEYITGEKLLFVVYGGATYLNPVSAVHILSGNFFQRLGDTIARNLQTQISITSLYRVH